MQKLSMKLLEILMTKPDLIGFHGQTIFHHQKQNFKTTR